MLRDITIQVATAEAEVEKNLRDLGEPICLFGEDPADRRNRLRERRERDEGGNGGGGGEDDAGDEDDDDDDELRDFTDGCNENRATITNPHILL